MSVAVISLLFLQTRSPDLAGLLTDSELAHRITDDRHVSPSPVPAAPGSAASGAGHSASTVPFNGHKRANATMLMLARNSDLNGVLQSVREAEDRFNREFQYPWVFLNEEEFSEDFKTCVQSSLLLTVHL